MFSAIFKMFRKNRAWRKVHEWTWSAALVRENDGPTRLQHLARTALEQQFGSMQLEALGVKERYLQGPLSGTQATLYIYSDGTQIHGTDMDHRME